MWSKLKYSFLKWTFNELIIFARRNTLEKGEYMINHFEMQQIFEAKKMEIDLRIQQQSSYRQIDKNNAKLSLFELFKKMFSNRKDSKKDEYCENC